MDNRVVRLRKILWADFLLGFVTAVAGLVLYRRLTSFLGLPGNLILLIASVTLVYSIVAFYLARQKAPVGGLLRILILANWAWTVFSVFLFFLFFSEATIFGVVFLVLQVIVVGGLAWLEGRALRKIF